MGELEYDMNQVAKNDGCLKNECEKNIVISLKRKSTQKTLPIYLQGKFKQ